MFVCFFPPPSSPLSSSLPRPNRRSRRRQRASLIKDTWWRPARPMLSCGARSAPGPPAFGLAALSCPLPGGPIHGDKLSLQNPPPNTHTLLFPPPTGSWVGMGVVPRVRPRRPPGGDGGFSAPSHITHGLMSWYVTCWW